MPTVLRVAGFQVRVYMRDHPPAHVHVWKAGAWVKVELPTDDAVARVVAVRGMTISNVIRAVRIVERHTASLRAAWEKYHGDKATE